MGKRYFAGIRDILALVDQSGPRAAERVAAAIAAATGGHLVGLVPGPTVSVASVAGGALAMSLVTELVDEADDRSNAALSAFEDIARKAGVAAEGGRYRFDDGDGIDLVARARLVDLAVAGQEDPEAPEPGRTAAIEALLFDAGAPVLLVPRSSDGGFSCRRVAIAWDGGRPAARAVRAAMPFITAAEHATIVVVGSDDETLGSDLAVHLAHHSVPVTVRHAMPIEGDVAAALFNETDGAGAELLVTGAYGRNRLLEFVLGGTTRSLLAGARVPVLMAH